ncbi:hypothetical protein DEI81_00390 [Curtobacterium sp. MCBD17_013]|nr:hypothetical protein DEI81_00390 [Curtobacterium sp. MCBD17_013]
MNAQELRRELREAAASAMRRDQARMTRQPWRSIASTALSGARRSVTRTSTASIGHTPASAVRPIFVASARTTVARDR